MSSIFQSRRRFLGWAGGFGIGAHPLWQLLAWGGRADASTPPAAGEYRAVVYLFLGGGMDSFNLLVPHDGASATHEDAHAEYAASRGALALAKESLHRIDPLNTPGRRFGVHPSMPRLAALFEARHAAFIANVGMLVERVEHRGQMASKRLPLGLGSHVEQAAQWQTALPAHHAATGWAGRMTALLQGADAVVPMHLSMDGTSVFQNGADGGGLAVDPVLGAVARTGYTAGHDPADEIANALSEALDRMQEQPQGHLLKDEWQKGQRAARAANARYATATAGELPGDIAFPDTSLGRQLRQVAKAIHGREALGASRQTFFVHRGGWDHHGDLLVQQAAMLGEVDDAIGAFWEQLVAMGIAQGEPLEGRVTLFSGSEFGRTLAGSGAGSEHGWGGNHFVVGGSVIGRKIYGSYPGLALNPDGGEEINPLDLGRGRLIPTLSCDEYFAELALWLGIPPGSLPQVLPNLENFIPSGGSFVPLGFLGPPGAPVNTAVPVLGFAAGNYSVTPGGWSGEPSSLTIEWHVNGILDESQTGAIYTGLLAVGDVLHALVTATNDNGTKSARSNPDTVPAPVDVTVWWLDRSENETGFRFEWGEDGTNFPNVVPVAAQATASVITFPGPGTYYGRIKAYNQAGESPPSNVLIIPV